MIRVDYKKLDKSCESPSPAWWDGLFAQFYTAEKYGLIEELKSCLGLTLSGYLWIHGRIDP
ncbi:hypothetical protein [Paenibacillus sp. SAF-068]|uniref:hypothetical protein n=1 Tax=Paenibacillus sp. SAF-068 TaxID=3436864 RepID=UPI003F80CBA7